MHYLKVAEAFQLDGLTVDDFYDWVLEGCASELARLAPYEPYAAETLHDYLHAQVLHCLLYATGNNDLKLLHNPSKSTKFPFGTRIRKELCSSWPLYPPTVVQIHSTSPLGPLAQTPRKVSVNGGCPFFFKPYRWCDYELAERELQKYNELKEAGLFDLQISRLNGVVCDENGILYGLLLSYIESQCVTLTCRIKPDTSPDLRRRWTEQVTGTLRELHQAGIVWGDVKPDNVLVDVDDNAWIIDFGGGHTEGWVDKSLAETVEGDQQGLSRMVDFIYDQERTLPGT